MCDTAGGSSSVFNGVVQEKNIYTTDIIYYTIDFIELFIS